MSLANMNRPDTGAYDVERVRRDFPILGDEMNGKPLVFLDSAASAQKPRAVIEAVRHVYEHEYANVHRGLYALSEAVTARYEGSREKVRALINAASTHEIYRQVKRGKPVDPAGFHQPLRQCIGQQGRQSVCDLRYG